LCYKVGGSEGIEGGKGSAFDNFKEKWRAYTNLALYSLISKFSA
jgi:hypothetical protein